MKIRIWINGEPLEIYAEMWIITKDRALQGIKHNVVDSIFYFWEKIEAMPDA